jgi:hypothetical protein
MTLRSTRFQGTAVSHKIIKDDDAKATVNANIGDVGGVLLTVITEGNVKSDSYVKIFDGGSAVIGASLPQLIFKCPKGATEIYELPSGFKFTNLSFWVTKNANPLDTANPDSKTTVTLLIG